MAKPKKHSNNAARGPRPRISDAEWVVMKTLWQQAPLTANQVVDSLAGAAPWKPRTVHTLLRRLVRKNAVRYEKRGREHWFHPALSAQECLREESRSFLAKLFDGRPAPFLACLLEEERLSAEEINELKRLLDERSPRNRPSYPHPHRRHHAGIEYEIESAGIHRHPLERPNG